MTSMSLREALADELSRLYGMNNTDRNRIRLIVLEAIAKYERRKT